MAEVIESATFRRWIGGLRDRVAVARINARLRKVSLGNMGDTKVVSGSLFEMRVHHGTVTGFTACGTATRWSCCVVATRAASGGTSNAPEGWRTTGGGNDRNIQQMGCC